MCTWSNPSERSCRGFLATALQPAHCYGPQSQVWHSWGRSRCCGLCYARSMQRAPLRLARHAAGPPSYALDGFASDEPVQHAIFTRLGGVSEPPYSSLNLSSSTGDVPSRVDANRTLVAQALGRPRSSMITAGLMHGTAVARVDASTAGVPLDGGGRYFPGVDALITNDPRATLLMTAADCAQVFLYDPRRRAVGLVHAGWRGIAAGVVGATIRAMHDHFGSAPADMAAGIGPCLGPCCARFSDPRRELPAWCAPFISGHHVDLWAMLRYQITGAGLDPLRIAPAEVCTKCRRDLFFSHRGDGGRTGRFAATLALL